MNKPKVFLAHASEDKDAVRELYAQLKAERFAPWLDEIDLIPGQNWQIEIPKAIKNCDIFVACISKRAIEKKGYVQKEFRLALDSYAERPPSSIFLIPVKLDDCDVPDLQLPMFGVALRDIQWVDLWKTGGLEKLVRAINHGDDSTNAGATVAPVEIQSDKNDMIERRRPKREKTAGEVIDRIMRENPHGAQDNMFNDRYKDKWLKVVGSLVKDPMKTHDGAWYCIVSEKDTHARVEFKTSVDGSDLYAHDDICVDGRMDEFVHTREGEWGPFTGFGYLVLGDVELSEVTD